MVKGWGCYECRRVLCANQMPKFTLNDLCLGKPPLELRRLTFVGTLLVAQHYLRCHVQAVPKGSRSAIEAVPPAMRDGRQRHTL